MRTLDIAPSDPEIIRLSREAGHEAFGCNCAPDKWIYPGDFLDVNFPTDWFDHVNCEISPSVEAIAEIHRVLRQGGTAMIRFNFAGLPVDHRLPNNVALERNFTNTGLGVINSWWDNGSLIFDLVKLRQKRTSILLPPGMGDCFWVITKLQSFLEKNNLGIPDVYVVSDTDNEFGRHNRVFEFIEMFPFLASTGVTITNGVDQERREICRQAYDDDGQVVFENVMGCDYFFGVNGPLHAGKTMAQIMPEYDTNWTPPMFVSLEQAAYMREAKQKYASYGVFYFSSVGTFKFWMNEFNEVRIIRALRQVVDRTGIVPVFAGGNWDRDGDVVLTHIIKNTPSAIDIRGETSVQELFGLLKGARIVVGWPSGLTIMAAALGIKTLAVWNSYYRKEHWWNVCSPDAHMRNYFTLDTDDLRPKRLANTAIRIMGAPG